MPLPFPIDWKAPNYRQVLEWRIERLQRIRADPDKILPALRTFYADNPAQFVTDWGMTVDPRLADLGMPTSVPFLLFPKQEDWVAWFMERWAAREPGLTEKARDMGVSWLTISVAATLCMFRRGIVAGFGSRKEDQVDRIGDPDCLFWKAREFVANVPSEFRAGWTRDEHAPFMRMIFPHTESMMRGEGGSNIGRGGRAQPLDVKVLTPDGWTTMGQIEVGDRVIGGHGQAVSVLGVYPQGVRQVFRVTFSDGSSTECCDEHWWRITTSAMRKTKRAKKPRAPQFAVLQLSDIRQSLQVDREQTEHRYQVPIVSAPVEFQRQALPLDPYLLGAMLGDGGMSQIKKSSPRFTTADDEMVTLLAARLPAGCGIVKTAGEYAYAIVDARGKAGRGKRSPMKVAITDLGLSGARSETKHIPDVYKFAAPAERLELLRGLLDTDGWCSLRGAKKGSKTCFTSTSQRLIEDVRFVVQSLGGVARTTGRDGRRRQFPGGRSYDCLPSQQLTICMPPGLNPFRLTRKASNWRERSTYPPSRYIVGVEPVGMKETRCIRVSAGDGLYLTDDCIVTHNSSFYFIDEAAHIEHPQDVDAALSQNTNCRMDLSSVKGMANAFAEKRFSGRVKVFVFDWRDHPGKDDAWYAKQKAELDPIILAQEVDRDYTASVEGVVIPNAWVVAAVDAHVKLKFQPTGQKLGGLDVADEGRDKNAFCGGPGILITRIEEWSGVGGDIFKTTAAAFDIADEEEILSFKYDADGLGAGVRGDARIINERRVAAGRPALQVLPYRGSGEIFDPDGEDEKGRKNKDHFLNAKAQNWWALRRRFMKTYRAVVEGQTLHPDELISISSGCGNYQKLMTELSQATWAETAAGKKFIVKAPDGTKSPNMADAVVIRFARTMRPAMRISPAAMARA